MRRAARSSSTARATARRATASPASARALGPDLTERRQLRGAHRSSNARCSIPQADVQPNHRFYRVVLQDGTTVTGRLLGHDTFTVQLLDTKEQLRSFVKSDLRAHGFVESPMPSYKNTLTPQEIADIVSYLSSLQGPRCEATASMLRLCAVLVLARRRVARRRRSPSTASSRGRQEPHNWLSYSGTPKNQRYSPLTQITTANVKNLQQQWIWQARSLEKFEATPLVVDGVMYTVEAPNNVVALDAATGRPFWTVQLHAGARSARLLRPRQPRRRDPRRHAVSWARSTRT